MTKKLLLSAAILLSSFALLFVGSIKSTSAAEKAPGVASVIGETNIGGEKVYVEILVAVGAGENPHAAAVSALKRAYPDAREVSSSEFSLTGLLWDQFTDENSSNDFLTVNYNNQKSKVTGAKDRLLSSLNTWTGVTSSNFTYVYGEDTARCPSLVRECRGPQYFDGLNDVSWLNIAERGVLGVTWYSTSRDEFDMAIDNKDFKWYAGIGTPPSNFFDLETVYLHEFGHGLGLGHSSVNGAVMEPYYEGARRVLHQDDVDGVSLLYPL